MIRERIYNFAKKRADKMAAKITAKFLKVNQNVELKPVTKQTNVVK